MAYAYSTRSEKILLTVHEDLQYVFNEAIRHRDVSITAGRRGKTAQNKLYLERKSKLKYPDSYHNAQAPELAAAVDAIPYPCTTEDWENREFWVEWSSWIKGLGSGLGITIISGYDWDNDYDVSDHTFYDGPHFQLTDEHKPRNA
jgi:hypothetical protein